jgi:hypothetical protein
MHSFVRFSVRQQILARAAVIAALLAATSGTLVAQGGAQVSPAVAAVITRVRNMADAGDGAKARTVLDSLVAAEPDESIDAGEALYWRAVLSEQSASAERDWKRLVVEIPRSLRVPDALMRLSELDIMHNNSLVARQRANRLLTDYPDAPQRTRAMIVIAQSYFNENDAPRACGVLTVVRREAPLSAVEVRLQADEMQQQCRNVREVAMGASPDATPAQPLITAPPATVASGRGGVPEKTAPAGRGGAVKPPLATTAGANIDPVPLATRDAIARATRDSIASANAARDLALKTALDSVTAANSSRARAAQMTRDSIATVKATREAEARNARDSITSAKATREAEARNARDSIAAARAARDVAAKNTRDSAAAALIAARSDASSSERAVAAQIVRDSLASIRLAAERKTRDSLDNVVRERRAAAESKKTAKAPLPAAAAPAPAVATTGRWTLQVAAYDTRAQADALVKKLIANDMAAHAVGARKPFRVQVGRFETRADAAHALDGMKKKGVNGFISEWVKR